MYDRRSDKITLIEVMHIFKICKESEFCQSLLESFEDGWQVEYTKGSQPNMFMRFEHKNCDPFLDFTIEFKFDIVKPSSMTNLASEFRLKLFPKVDAKIYGIAEARYVADMLRQFEQFKNDVEKCKSLRDFQRLSWNK